MDSKGNTYSDYGNHQISKYSPEGKLLVRFGRKGEGPGDIKRLGWFDRAIENFTRANEIDPAHATSFYNLGVVYRYDLQNFDKAKEAWTRFLEINPTGPGSDRVRQDLASMQAQPPVQQQQK